MPWKLPLVWCFTPGMRRREFSTSEDLPEMREVMKFLTIGTSVTSIMVIAALITIAECGIVVFNLPSSRSTTDQLTFPKQTINSGPASVPATTVYTPAPSPTPALTPTPTPVPPLGRQLKDALSISGRDARDAALLAIAQQAIQKRDYWTALRVAEASLSTGAQARALVHVGRCAIKDGMVAIASQAADRIKANNYRDRFRAEVIEARNPTASGVSADFDKLNIGPLTCPLPLP